MMVVKFIFLSVPVVCLGATGDCLHLTNGKSAPADLKVCPGLIFNRFSMDARFVCRVLKQLQKLEWRCVNVRILNPKRAFMNDYFSLEVAFPRAV